MDEKINGSEDFLRENSAAANEQNLENEEISNAPETVSESAPAVEPEVATENAPEAAPESVPETAPEVSPESVPETAREVAPESVPEAAPESEPEAEPEAEPEVAPETTPELKPAQYAYKWDYTTQAEHNAQMKRKDAGRGAFLYATIISAVFAVAFLLLALFVIFGKSVSPTIVYNGTASVESIAAEKMLPSTILIYTSSSYGSGFIISEDGYAVTNHHVIATALDDGLLQVELYNGKQYKATVVGSSENDDLAVIKIDGRGFVPSEIGSSASLVMGEDVVAIGNPGGPKYSFTVTGGVISSLNRDIKVFDSNNVYQRTVKALQFSAIVNNGNSGGPLVNKYGQVVGVISMKSSSSYAGIGFAFPIDESMEIINEIIKNGNADGIDSPLSIERPMLGITAVGVTANKWYIITDNGTKQIKEDELENYPDAFKAGHTGVLITEVSAGTGAYGKLQKNDIILKINGQSVINVATISYVLVDAKAGDTAEVDFARGDKIMSAKIVLS